MDRGVAIRYMGPSGASVAWHTQEDLDQRGHVITRLSTLGEYTNEQYQETGPNRARGCLLLTDEDACECAVCVEVGWPEELRLASERGEDVRVAETMGPAAGRDQLAVQEVKLKAQQKRMDRERLKRRNIDQHQRNEVTTARKKKKKKAGGKRQLEASESFAAHDQQDADKEGGPGLGAGAPSPELGRASELAPGREVIRPLERDDGPISPMPTDPDAAELPPGVGESRDRGDHLGPGAEDHPWSEGSGGDQRSPAKTHPQGDQEQSNAETDRNKQRREGVGLAGQSGQAEPSDPEADNRMDEHLDMRTRAQDQQPEGGRSVGLERDVATGEDEGSRQGGSDRSNKDVDAHERAANEVWLSDPEDREERNAEILQAEPLLQTGRDRGHVRSPCSPDQGGHGDDGTRQRLGWEERLQGQMDHRVLEMGKRQRVVATGITDTGGDNADGNTRAEQDEGTVAAERGLRPKQDTRHRRGMGINRNSSVPDARGMLDSGPGQGRVLGARLHARRNHEQAEDGPLLRRQDERLEEGGKIGDAPARVICPSMALTRVQDPNISQLHECIEALHEREAAARPEEPDEPEHPGPETGRTETVQPSNRAPAPGTGGGDQQHCLCSGEPSDQRPLEHGGSNRKTVQPDVGLASSDSRPVRIRQEMQETHKDPDEYQGLEAQGNYRTREVHPLEVRRDSAQHPGPWPGEARAANDSIRPKEKTEGGRSDRQRRQEGVFSQGGEKPRPSPTGTRDRESGPREPVRTRAKAKAHRQQTDNEWKDKRNPKRTESAQIAPERNKRKHQGEEQPSNRATKRIDSAQTAPEHNKRKHQEEEQQPQKKASQNDTRTVGRLRKGVG